MKRGLILSTLILLVLGGCGNPLTDFALFNAYRGVNLMAGVEFQFNDPSTDPNWNYIHASPIGVLYEAAGVPGPDGAFAIRLRSENQFVDGDFGSGIPWEDASTNSSTIISNSLRFRRSNDGDFPYVNLTPPSPDQRVTTFTEPSTYRIIIDHQLLNPPTGLNDGFFGFITFDTGSVPDSIRDDSSVNFMFRGPLPRNSRISGLQHITEDTSLAILSQFQTDVIIDAVRMLQVPNGTGEDNYGIALNLPKLPQPELPLQSGGFFEFTMAIQNDPDADSNNIFRAEHLTVELVFLDSSGNQVVGSRLSQTLDSVGASWTDVTFRIPNPINNNDILNQLANNDHALSIRLFPFKRGELDAGSVLLSNPRLFWSPN